MIRKPVCPINRYWPLLVLVLLGFQTLKAQTVVYSEDFEANNGGWITYDSTSGIPASSWAHGAPTATLISSANSGTNAWVTNLSGDHTNNEASYLESPAFNFSALTIDPDLSFALFYDTESCCDRLSLEFSIDGGLTWSLLGAVGSGSNWYNFASPDSWRNASGGWVNASIRMAGTAGLSDVRLRFLLESDISVFNEGGAIDDVMISIPGADDVSTVAINLPIQSCFGATQVISADFTNIGTDDQFNFLVGYSIDGGTVVTETFTDTLEMDSILTFNFATLADLSGIGAHTVEVFTLLVGDGDTSNDSLNITVNTVAPINTYPYLEDFESFTNCISACGGSNCVAATANNWVQELGDASDWSINSGLTTSGSTGPDVDHTFGTAAGTYIYTEATGCNNTVHNLTSPCFDLGSLTNPSLEFYYHMTGLDVGTLNVDISNDNGLTWTNLFTQTGQVQTTTTDDWIVERVLLSAYVGQTVTFRIQGITGPNFESDIAVDDFQVFNQGADDLSVEAILDPVPGGLSCSYASTNPVSVSIKNFGSADQTNFSVSYSLNGGPLFTETFPGTLEGDSTATFTFASTVDLSVSGNYNVTVFTSLSGDSDTTNDTAQVDIETRIVSTFPYLEDFETFTFCSSQGGSQNCSGNVMNGWRQDGADDNDWRPNSGPTVSPGTGPTGDNTTGSGQYVYIEASSPFNLTSNLWSPCFDISSLTSPTVSFAYHMFGATTGTLNLDITTDQGATWTNIWTRSGEVQTADTLPYLLDSVDLSAYIAAGVVAFRLQGIAGNDFTSDISVDDFRVFNVVPNNIGITSVDMDPISCGLNDSVAINVTITNFGTNTQTGFPVSYQIDGGTVVSGILNIPIPGGDSLSVTFGTTADLSASGFYNLQSWTSLATDADLSDDTTSFGIVSTSSITTYPYEEDFEAQTTCSNLGGPQVCPLTNDWVQAGNTIQDDNDWRVNIGGTTSTLTGPSADNTLRDPNGHYLYTEGSNVFDLSNVIYTPCFDLSLLTNPSLRFFYHMFGADMGTMNVDISTDRGETWGNLFTQTGQVQTADTDPWELEQIDLAAFANQTVNFRFVGLQGSGFDTDMALDDIFVGEFETCLPPTLNIVFIDSTSAQIQVVGVNNTTIGFPVEFGLEGFTPGTGVTGVASGGVDTLIGLTPNTTYEIYIQDACAVGDSSSVVGPIAFTTNCSAAPQGDSATTAIPITNFPFTTVNNTDTCYNNVSGLTPSVDVFYQFTTGACADSVTISTCSAITEFDTRVYLVNDTGLVVADNDDAPTGSCGFTLGGLNRFSVLNADVDPNTTYFVVVAGFAATDEGEYELTIDLIENEPVLTVDSLVNPVCFGDSTGSIQVTVTGGNPPYTFDWGNGITAEDPSGLAAATYTVVVTDTFGCSITDSVTLTSGTPISINIDAITDVSCNGDSSGAIAITVSGGAGGHTFDWGNGITAEDPTGLFAGTYNVVVTDSLGCTATASATITEPLVISIIVDLVTDVNCNGDSTGDIDIIVTGGTAPYTYNWGNGITVEDPMNLAAGTYNLVLVDSLGCMATAVATVNEPAPIAVAVDNVTNVTINGDSTGAIAITVTGGTAPYTYDWGNGITDEDPMNLTAGIYTGVVTDSLGCTASVTVTVTEPTAVVIVLDSVTNVICNGDSTGAIAVTVTGGIPPYTYDWGNGITDEDPMNLPAGVYNGAITDSSGSTAFITVTITESTAIAIALDSVSNVNCNGDSTGAIAITVTGGTAPYTYDWGNGITDEDPMNLPAGMYTGMVTDSLGCMASAMITITEPTAIAIALDSVSNVNCNGDSTGAIAITVTGGTGSYTFDWGNGITDEDPINLPAGMYTGMVTDSLGCTASAMVTITEPTAIAIALDTVINVNCNGDSTGAIAITVTGGTGSYSFDWGNGITDEDPMNLSAGTYNLVVTDSLGCTATDSVMVSEPTAIAVAIDTVINVNCNGDSTGSIAITVTGGTGSYSFDWGNGITDEDPMNLSAGTYNLVVTDSLGCTATDSVMVSEPTAIAVAIDTVINVNCNGDSTGSIAITVTGGTGSYSFDWGNGITDEDPMNLAAGTYNLVVTDSLGCTVTDSATILEPAAIAVVIDSVVNVNCNGDSTGSIAISVSGGSGSYSFDWGNGITDEDPMNLAAGTYNLVVTDSLGCTATDSATILEPAAIAVVIDSVVNVNCNGDSTGSIAITVTGGTGNYSFDWGNGITDEDPMNLSAGSYNLVVTDSLGCTATDSATILEPTAIAVVIDSVVNVTCNGDSIGSIAITVTGGTGSYSFDWGNGITDEDPMNLFAGTYNLIVTDSLGCTATDSATILEPTAIAVVIDSVVNVTCNGDSIGSIAITVTGGTGSYSFDWGNGITDEDPMNLFAGTYNLIVTDSLGCTATDSAVVSESSAIVIVVDSILDVTCNGDSTGSIAITVTGGTGSYTFDWGNGITDEDPMNLPAGMYTGMVTDSLGCMASAMVTINEPAPLSGTTVVTDESSTGATDGAIDLTPSGGSAPYSYQWSNGDTNEDLSNLAPGPYCVTITDVNGCTFELCDTVGTIVANEVEVLNVFEVYPNPTNGRAQVKLEFANSSDIHLQVVTLLGQVIIQRTEEGVNATQYEIDLSAYTQGTYFVRLVVNGKSYSKKVILRR